MGLFGIGGSKSWRGEDGEKKMTDEDWQQRAGEQARAAIFGAGWDMSSPDEDGNPTGGCYNGDYPDSWHEECNRKLDNDEYYESEVEQSLWSLFRADNARREDEDSD